MILALLILAGVSVASAASAQSAPMPVTAEARQTLAAYGQCLVRREPGLAHETLIQDFRSPGYRAGMRRLAGRNNDDCLNDWVWQNGIRQAKLRAEGLPFAAAIAEALIARSREPLNVRLAKAARTEAASYSVTDRIAMCVARSDPDGTARLLTSKVGSPEEEAAVAAVMPVGQRCADGVGRLDMPTHAMRAMVATASYRLLAAAEAAK